MVGKIFPECLTATQKGPPVCLGKPSVGISSRTDPAARQTVTSDHVRDPGKATVFRRWQPYPGTGDFFHSLPEPSPGVPDFPPPIEEFPHAC
jgi:hypothetical protein